ncbi:long-chain fatty acid--CoA ligase, partial [Gardnerella swidsinskii]|nr:long-chain fatty acid--CoA ligase [Gardnerella swidsinskii]
ARKALQIGSNFAHPVSDDRSGSQNYSQVEEKQEATNTLLAQKSRLPLVDLPRVEEWGAEMPTTTFLDPQTGLLTTK